MRRGPWAEADDLDVKVNLTRTPLVSHKGLLNVT